jgi:hypothetical protein
MIEDVFYYTHNKCGVQRNIDRHQIKFHELTFLLEGKMTYYVNDISATDYMSCTVDIVCHFARYQKCKLAEFNLVSLNFSVRCEFIVCKIGNFVNHGPASPFLCVLNKFVLKIFQNLRIVH